MDSPDNKKLSSDVLQRLYLMGFLVCMLAVVGVGILFLMPDATLEDWLTQTEPVEEEWTGDAGSLPRAASGSASNGASHNDSAKTPASRLRPPAEEPASIASASPDTTPQRPASSVPSDALAAQTETPAAQSAPRTSSTPDPAIAAARQPVPESGVGEITILSMPPGMHVGVADQVLTQAPATVRVPWPADYEVAVHVGDSTIYATRLYLSAENHAVSFSVGAEPSMAAASHTANLVADAARHEHEQAEEPDAAHLVGIE